MSEHDVPISALLSENRKYYPDETFAAQANAKPSIYDIDPDVFWEEQARLRVSWFQPWTKLYQWDLPYAKWYVDGKLNVCYNCVDRHVESGGGSKVAYYWEGEPVGDRRTITYDDLLRYVVQFANALKSLGVKKGTPVGIYMGMVPELPIAMLACTRIGAPHTVVFGGFSSESLAARLNDMKCEILITQDAGYRRGALVPLKANTDEALKQVSSVKKVIVFRRVGHEIEMDPKRDIWWHELVEEFSADPKSCPCEVMDSEDLLYLLYSSGTTAKPKAIMHTTGGYLVGVATTHYYVFDIKPQDVYWCAADIGWVTGHSYIVYGPLCNHTTGVIYEGSPDFPDKDRWWDIVERYRVSILYTAPTAIRTHMKWGPDYAKRHDLSSLRLLGSVGEPINPEAWVWYREHIGGGRTPIVDTWWQTETGMIMITPLPGVSVLKPGSASRPFPGVEVEIVDDAGRRIEPGKGAGYLCITRPFPAMLRGLFNDPDRYVQTYWSRFPGKYFTGDGARQDEDGDFWLMGRVDDVMNVSGHRLSTIEIESALVDHPAVAEAAVCGRADPITGQAVVAYVILKGGRDGNSDLAAELREHVAKKIGPIARPANIIFTPELPKTRSGKIMRRLLRDIAEERALGDTTTLADQTVVEEIRVRSKMEQYREE